MNQQDIDAAMVMVEKARPDIAAVLRTLPISFTDMPDSVWGGYMHESNSVELNQHATLEVEDLAAILLHEGNHAEEAAKGFLIDTEMKAYLHSEVTSKKIEIDFIQSHNPHGKKVIDRYDEDINDWIADKNDGTLNKVLRETYTELWEQQEIAQIAQSLGLGSMFGMEG